MNHIVMREQKIALVSGILCTLFFGAVCIYLFLSNVGIVTIFVLPFVLLGIYLILMYFRHTITLEPAQIVVSEPFRKKNVIRHAEIGTVLIHTANKEVSIILLGRKKDRLMKFGMDMVNAEKAVDLLEDLEIPCRDLAGMAACGENIEEYLPCLTKGEKFFYRPLLKVTKPAKKNKTSPKMKKLKKQKKFLKAAGWVMLGLEALALMLGGKWMLAGFVFVLLLAWGLYVWMYPNLFIEVNKNTKLRKYVLEMPAAGPGIALLFCINTYDLFDFDYGSFLIYAGIYTLILLVPLVLKLCTLKEKPEKTRILASAFLALLFAFSTFLPVNHITTSQSEGHEVIVVDDLVMSGGRYRHYDLYAVWRGERQSFSISHSEYKKYQEGDQIRVCLRRSIFGFHYWTVHE